MLPAGSVLRLPAGTLRSTHILKIFQAHVHDRDLQRQNADDGVELKAAVLSAANGTDFVD